MLLEFLTDYRCPESGSPLTLRHDEVREEQVVSGELVSPEGRIYKIEQGVPNFVDSATLTPGQSKTQTDYDNVAVSIYDIAVNWQFAAMYEDEDRVRES